MASICMWTRRRKHAGGQCPRLLLIRVVEFGLVLAPPELAPVAATPRWLPRPITSKDNATHFFFVDKCSAKTSTPCCALNSRMKRGSQSSDAMPRSLQQRMSALLLHASVAVGMPDGSKYSCSPRAIATSLFRCGVCDG
jgi:hypothetical protein